MGHHHHNHAHGSSKNIRSAFLLNTIFAFIELFGGIYVNSVAIVSDAIHDFGDSISLGVAYWFEKKSVKKANAAYSYGYRRFSVLGAMFTVLVLSVSSVLIIIESVKRLSNPQMPDVKGMIVFACLGVFFNTLAFLRVHKGGSVNEKVVSLHFIEDILGWIAVLVGSIIMFFKEIPILDVLLSLGISLYILFNVYKNLKYIFNIILQGVPENIDVGKLKADLLSVNEVRGIHDLHMWSMDGDYNVGSVHLVIKDEIVGVKDVTNIKKQIRSLAKQNHLDHLTIELERASEECLDGC